MEKAPLDNKEVHLYGDRLSEFLLLKQRTRTYTGQLLLVAQKFEKVYQQLPEISKKILQEYKKLLAKYSIDPGIVKLYMVGGRIKGNPLKEDSDIDLKICVENPARSMEHIFTDLYENPIDALAFRIALQQEMLKSIQRLCDEAGIENEFHVLSHGSAFPEEENTEKLLLAEVN